MGVTTMGIPDSVGAIAAPARLLLQRVPDRRLARWTNLAATKWRHDFVTTTSAGVIMAGNTHDIIQRYVWLFGRWEPSASAWLSDTLKPGDGFIDVGANVGYFSLLAARTGGPVVAVEPSPDAASALRRNVALNRFANVRVVQAAATVKRSVLTLHAGSALNSGVASTTLAQADGPTTQVEGLPLADILTESELDRARVIKIDVEGGELDAISGLLPVLEYARPDLEIMIEVTPDLMRRVGQHPTMLVSRLAAFGFQPYRLSNDYRVESYLEPPTRPERFAGPVEAETDFVFSRRDVQYL
jgi:FkbM family methyltransferase